MGGALPKSLTYLDIAIDGLYAGTLIIEMFEEECPLTCYNFKMLCTGDLGQGRAGKPLHYSGTPIHKVIPERWLQGGDVTHHNGDGGESCLQGGTFFDDENLFSYKHGGPGYVAMANSGPNSNKSQFYIIFRRCEWLDGTAVVFGKVWRGLDMLKKIEALGSEDGTPAKKITICDSGIYDPVQVALQLEETRLAEAKMPQLFDDQTGREDFDDEATRLVPANKPRVIARDALRAGTGPAKKARKPPSLQTFEAPF